jgi:hypothetical protein
MPSFGKPDATGRSSGKLNGRSGRNARPPAGEPWAWLTAELLASDAWRSLSINARRVIDFLLVEHCGHAGRENGRLKATHDQLYAFGVTNGAIRKAIDECCSKGLLVCVKGGRWGCCNVPSLYRLTFYADADANPATDDWKRFKLAPIKKQFRTSSSRNATPCKNVPRHHLRVVEQ